jgi:nitrite reductase/ring-hydroxylating ferredoxin subunit
MSHAGSQFVPVASLAALSSAGCLVVQAGGRTIALFLHEGKVFAVDNRCPHMGFPLDRGTCGDGILTCHWHHARFDLASGGTFDLWADDLPVYPVEVRGGEVLVDVAGATDPDEHLGQRLDTGLERNIPLVIAKTTLRQLDRSGDPRELFRRGIVFGTKYRQAGWGPGLTILTAMMNLHSALDQDVRALALYHGLSAVAADCDGVPPRFAVRPLPLASSTDLATLARWFRQFIEVRDAEGAERCIVSAIRSGADSRQMSDMLLAAATDHRYIDTGHRLDFTNKAFEALEHSGWGLAESVLSSLADGYTGATRMEESNAWRHPVDLVVILDNAFERLPAAIAARKSRQSSVADDDRILPTLLGDDPHAIAESLLDRLAAGTPPDRLASCVVSAASLRIAQFHTSNEYGDWDTALHTFTFASAVHRCLRRNSSPELLRGVFDAAFSVYLDRFLNIPAARLPYTQAATGDPDLLLAEIKPLFDQRHQVQPAGDLVSRYLSSGGSTQKLIAALSSALLREDRDFHSLQMLEAAAHQATLAGDALAGHFALVAAARYLAAHCPTSRAHLQTYRIALRLARGDRLFDDEPAGDDG